MYDILNDLFFSLIIQIILCFIQNYKDKVINITTVGFLCGQNYLFILPTHFLIN